MLRRRVERLTLRSLEALDHSELIVEFSWFHCELGGLLHDLPPYRFFELGNNRIFSSDSTQFSEKFFAAFTDMSANCRRFQRV